jgi:hypothetical protein
MMKLLQSFAIMAIAAATTHVIVSRQLAPPAPVAKGVTPTKSLPTTDHRAPAVVNETQSSSPRSYDELRERHSCLPDLNAMPDAVAARTPFGSRRSLEAFIMAYPDESVATYRAITNLLGPVASQASSCFAEVGVPKGTTVLIELDLSSNADDGGLTITRPRAAPGVQLPAAATACLAKVLGNPLSASASDGTRFIDYTGILPFRLDVL